MLTPLSVKVLLVPYSSRLSRKIIKHLPFFSLLLSQSKTISSSSLSQSSYSPSKLSAQNHAANHHHSLHEESEIFTKLQNLATKSSSLQKLSNEEKIVIIDEIMDQICKKTWMNEKFNGYNSAQHELSLLKLAPPLPSYTHDHTNASESSKAGTSTTSIQMNHSSDSMTSMAMHRFGIIYTAMGVLHAYKQRLEYDGNDQGSVINNKGKTTDRGSKYNLKSTPKILKNVQSFHSTNGKKIQRSWTHSDAMSFSFSGIVV
mmetsp:Transcript_10880/g.12609  ORF Transcript_10880/g.12609 Transcript_10880/m.12609 type:complete len:259 (+) Transcript_10880:82-858(+)